MLNLILLAKTNLNYQNNGTAVPYAHFKLDLILLTKTSFDYQNNGLAVPYDHFMLNLILLTKTSFDYQICRIMVQQMPRGGERDDGPRKSF
jgi:hypothetical protein